MEVAGCGSAELSAQHSNLAKGEKVRECREEMEVAEERLVLAHVAASYTRDEDKMPKEVVSKFKADYVAKKGRWWDEIGKLTKQLRQQAEFAATGRKS